MEYSLAWPTLAGRGSTTPDYMEYLMLYFLLTFLLTHAMPEHQRNWTCDGASSKDSQQNHDNLQTSHFFHAHK